MNDKQYNGYINERDDEYVAKKINGADIPQYYPTCRFCGKQKLPLAAYKNQTEADEAATITCDCYDARVYQQKKEQETTREKNIIKLRQILDDFSKYCEGRNTKLENVLFDLLLSTGISVLDGVIASAALKFRKMKVNINTNNKGNIVIGFTYSDGSKVEVL